MPVRGYLDFMIGDILSDTSAALSERTARSMLALVEDLIDDLLGVGANTGRVPRPMRSDSAQTVRAAGELLRQRADEPLSIAALADELRIGLRSLQLSFREVYGLSPRELLGRLRLETASERLLAADPSEQVTTVALDCGFPISAASPGPTIRPSASGQAKPCAAAAPDAGGGVSRQFISTQSSITLPSSGTVQATFRGVAFSWMMTS